MESLDRQILQDPNCPFKLKPRQDGCPGVQLDHGYKNMGDYWLQQSEQHRKHDYIVTEARRATYGDMRRTSIMLALGMQAQYGVARGDRVAILSRNTIEFVTVFWALQLLGAVPAPINAFQKPDAMAACINMIGARLILVDEGAWSVLLDQYAALFQGRAYDGKSAPVQAVCDVIVIAERDATPPMPSSARPWMQGPYADPRIHDWDELLYRWRSYEHATPPSTDHTALTHHALILFTSGTTSLPKPVVSNQDQVLTSQIVAAWYYVRVIVQQLGSIPSLEMVPKRRLLCMVPLFHVMGLESAVLTSVLSGDAVILLHKYSAEKAIQMIQREQVTSTIGIGFMVQELMQSGATLESLSGFTVGGAASPETLPAHAKKRGLLGGSNGYGLTETNSGVLVNVGPGYEKDPNSVGIPAPMVDVRIRDPHTGDIVPRGRPGELLIRAPSVAQGYFEQPEATRATFTPDGFFCTGDVAIHKEDGNVYILDRLKDLIIRKGENISGPMVEHALMREPRIKDCAVVALPDTQLGERVAGVCVVDATHRPTEHEVVQSAAASLPPHAVPDYVWLRTEPLPRNAAGKVVKAALRTELRAHVAEAQRRGTFHWHRAARL